MLRRDPSGLLRGHVHDEPELRRRARPRSRRTCSRSSTQHGCTSGNCHGAPQSDFYITCGSTPDELAFNFTQAWAFVNTPVDDSQILECRSPSPSGGRGHTGGDQFSSTTTPTTRRSRPGRRVSGVLDFATPAIPSAVLPGQRAADPDRARLRVRGVPQPDGHRTTSSCAPARRASFGDRAREELRAREGRLPGAGVPRRAPQSRVMKTILADDSRSPRSAASRTAAVP